MRIWYIITPPKLHLQPPMVFDIKRKGDNIELKKICYMSLSLVN